MSQMMLELNDKKTLVDTNCYVNFFFCQILRLAHRDKGLIQKMF